MTRYRYRVLDRRGEPWENVYCCSVVPITSRRAANEALERFERIAPDLAPFRIVRRVIPPVTAWEEVK